MSVVPEELIPHGGGHRLTGNFYKPLSSALEQAHCAHECDFECVHINEHSTANAKNIAAEMNKELWARETQTDRQTDRRRQTDGHPETGGGQ